mgnify:CR=1 FL=1
MVISYNGYIVQKKRNELKKLYNGSRGWVEKVNNIDERQKQMDDYEQRKDADLGKFDDIYKRR